MSAKISSGTTVVTSSPTKDKTLHGQVSGRKPPLPPVRPLPNKTDNTTSDTATAMYTSSNINNNIQATSVSFQGQRSSQSSVSKSPTTIPITSTTSIEMNNGMSDGTKHPILHPLPRTGTPPMQIMHPPLNVSTSLPVAYPTPVSGRSSMFLSQNGTTSIDHGVSGSGFRVTEDVARNGPAPYQSSYVSQPTFVSAAMPSQNLSSFSTLNGSVAPVSAGLMSTFGSNGYATRSTNEEYLSRIRTARCVKASTSVQTLKSSEGTGANYDNQMSPRPVTSMGKENSVQNNAPYLGHSSVDQSHYLKPQMSFNGDFIHTNGTNYGPDSNVNRSERSFEHYYDQGIASATLSPSGIQQRDGFQSMRDPQPCYPNSSNNYSSTGQMNGKNENQFRNLPMVREKRRILTSAEMMTTAKQDDGTQFIKESIEDFAKKGIEGDRGKFLSEFSELMECYDNQMSKISDAVEETCLSLVLSCKIPHLNDQVLCPIDDETKEDAEDKLLVKKKFVEAMENLQKEQQPSKRRGNLPKESTAYLKKWFEDHSDNPYPTDEQKKEMSRITNIDVTQISHWFINYRKRIWKPNLSPSHPAMTNDLNKRPRKKGRSQ